VHIAVEFGIGPALLLKNQRFTPGESLCGPAQTSTYVENGERPLWIDDSFVESKMI